MIRLVTVVLAVLMLSACMVSLNVTNKYTGEVEVVGCEVGLGWMEGEDWLDCETILEDTK